MIDKIKADFSKFNFKPGTNFMWSPQDKTIFYEPQGLADEVGLWSLLHELGHAISGHNRYELDIELLKIELEAWQEARRLAAIYNIEIDNDHIEDSLDTYRDWLKKRSTCPDCGSVCTQTKANQYVCHNCRCRWQVPKSQICRITRRKILIQK